MKIQMQKWPKQPHWGFQATPLGEDDHGSWFGLNTGTQIIRPGFQITADCPQLVLVSTQHFVATFFANQDRDPCYIYVDISSLPNWFEGKVEIFDLDLDVLRNNHGEVWIEDVDEFKLHQQKLAYPAWLIEAAETSCTKVLQQLTELSGAFRPEISAKWFSAYHAIMK